MAADARPPRPPIDAWQVEMLRVTGFTAAPIPDTPPNWWTTVVGQPPQTTQIERKDWTHTERGPCCGGVLVNNIQPSRIDWALVRGDEEIASSGLQTFGSLTEIAPNFLPLMDRWLDMETCPQLRRLAFGAVILLPVESQLAGYRQIAAYLPSVQIDPENSSDLLYRINRPRNLKKDGTQLTINRLSTWVVLASHRFWATIGVSQGSQTELKKEELGFACRLEMDINNRAAQDIQMSGKNARSVLQDLVNLAFEIAAEGDVP